MRLSLSVILSGPGCGRRWTATRRPLVGDRIDRDIDLAHIDEQWDALGIVRPVLRDCDTKAINGRRAALQNQHLVGAFSMFAPVACLGK